MVSGSLALLYFLHGLHGGGHDSGPDRGPSPVEWGDFPFVYLFVCLFVRPFVRSPSGLRLQAWLAGPQAWLVGSPRGGTYVHTYGQTNVRTDERTNGKSPHSTGLRPLSGPLPCLPP